MRNGFFCSVIVCFFTIIIFTASCSKEEESIQSKLNNIDGQGYFPLNLGDIHKYSLEIRQNYVNNLKAQGYSLIEMNLILSQTINPWQAEIDKVVEFDGVEYFQSNSEERNSYIRLSVDNKVFIKAGNMDVLCYDLSAEIGDSWFVSEDHTDKGRTCTLSSKSDTVTLNGVKLYNCYRYFFDTPGWIDDEVNIWLAPNIGKVQISGQIGTVKLRYAKIADVELEF